MNKGKVFGKIICHDPEALQGEPLIEQLLAETVGPDWVVTSFLSIIAGRGGHPQTLHQDGGVMMTETPLLVNQMFMLDDVNHLNGGASFYLPVISLRALRLSFRSACSHALMYSRSHALTYSRAYLSASLMGYGFI